MAAMAHAALPESPNQHKRWRAPSSRTVPAYVTKAAILLFNAGLADPRGGSYRWVEVLNPRYGKNTTLTHAWVFRGGYAVCWNGLVYRVRDVGARADLDRDVQTILGTPSWKRRNLGFLPVANPPQAAFWSDLQDKVSIAPTALALLLRLGKTGLAERLWQAPESPDSFGQIPSRTLEEHLWLANATTAWFAIAFGRLVGAFEVGDDKTAADLAESILDWQSRVPPDWLAGYPRIRSGMPDLSFLKPVPTLLEDSRRRLREPKRPALDDGAARAEFSRKPQAARIAELIDRLEDVRGQQSMIPGPFTYDSDPVYALLRREGEAAIEPLREAYEDDRRLTRTFGNVRPWFIQRTPVTVHTVIGRLLSDVHGQQAGNRDHP